MSYYYSSPPTPPPTTTATAYWGDVDSREAFSGLELQVPSTSCSANTFGRKQRRAPPALPFTHERTVSASSTASYSSATSDSSAASETSTVAAGVGEQHCCSHRRSSSSSSSSGGLYGYGYGYGGEARAKTPPQHDEWVEPSLSPRPRRKRDVRLGAGVRGNTRTSFTAEGDRVEEFTGEGSLRIGTHWVEDDEAAAAGRARGGW